MATLLSAPERLKIHWPDLDRDLVLTRRADGEADFYPRKPGTAYSYTRPANTGDGWQTARAADAGMDEAALAQLVQRIIDSDPTDKYPGLIHSLLVAHKGKLVLEEYFFGFDRNTPHDLRSAGKTFASILLGAQMRQGTRIAPQSRILDLVKGNYSNPDPRKNAITLAQLMTHTSGLACDDNDEDSPGGEETMQTQSAQPHWWTYTLDLPMANDPGTRYAYCSGGMNLMGAALTSATHTWLPELFERDIAEPLQFGRYYWNLMPDGEGYLGGGAHVLPRDLLKVGQMYLDGGMWNGKRIVDANWIALSTAPHAEISPKTTGLSDQDFSNSYIRGQDGYAWHLSKLKTGDKVYDDYAATGNGGQLLIVVPDLELAVVFTAGNYGQGGIWNRFRSEIVPREIISAIKQ